MKNKTTALLLCVFLFPFKMYGINIDSLLDAKIPVEKPYLVINVTSTDCINCRAGSLKILYKLNGSGYKDKIVLLSDDKNMASYFQENADKFDGYRKVYDKALSNALALGPSCTASLIQASGIHSCLFNNLPDDTLDYFKNILDDPNPDKSEKVRDTIFTDLPNLNYGKDNAILFNSRFQIGLLYNMPSKAAAYLKPTVSDTTADMIYGMAKKNGMKNSSDANAVKKVLRMVGMPMVMLEGINVRDNSALFKLNGVRLDTTYKGTDTMINSNISGQIFLAKNIIAGHDMLNVGSYRDYMLFDSVHYKDNVFWPHTSINYQVCNGHIYMAYCDFEHSKKTMMQGREVTIPTALEIVEFSDEGGKAKAINTHYIKHYEGGDLFFRIDDNGKPVTVDNTKKTFALLEENKTIRYNNYACGPNETVSRIFDFSIERDTIKFVGITNNSHCVKGIYSIANKKMVLTKINNNTIYQSMSMENNSILGCKKNVETNELTFDRIKF